MLWVLFVLAAVGCIAVFGGIQWRHNQTLKALRTFGQPRGLTVAEHAPALRQLVEHYAQLGGSVVDVGHLLVSDQPKLRGGAVAYPFEVGETDVGLLDRVVFFRTTITSGNVGTNLGVALAVTFGSGLGERNGEVGVLYYPIPASFPTTLIRPKDEAHLPALLDTTSTAWGAFNARFEVQTVDPGFTSALFDPRMLEFWESRMGSVQVNFVPGAVLLIQNRRWDTADYDHLVGIAEQLEARIPRHLVTQYR